MPWEEAGGRPREKTERPEGHYLHPPCSNLHFLSSRFLLQENLDRAERNVLPKTMPLQPAALAPTNVKGCSPVVAKALAPETSKPSSQGPGECKVTAHPAAQGMWIYRLG